MSRLRLPGEGAGARPALATAAVVWASAAVGRTAGWSAVAGAVVMGAVGMVASGHRLRLLLLGAAIAGSVSGASSSAREEAILRSEVGSGHVVAVVEAMVDPRDGRFGWELVVKPTFRYVDGKWKRWEVAPLLVRAEAALDVQAGDRLDVRGALEPGGFRWRGDPVAGVIEARDIIRVAGPESVTRRVANAVRSLVVRNLRPSLGPSRALLAGFLVGDTSGLDVAEVDRLRRAGLSHFVAVSGSNVALFLGLWWLVTGSLGARPGLRAGLGLVALVVFSLATRLEPSVVRAAVMAGLVLVARALGVALDGWTALGTAVIGVLLVSGELVGDVGFQLSVAATAGVMAGAGAPTIRPRWMGAALASTLAAQLAVAPILLITFSGVPLLSPIANVVALPLVTAATISGGLGAIVGLGPLIAAGSWLAGLVLVVARVAAPWPQVGWIGAGLLGAAVVAGMLVPAAARSLGLLGALVAALVVWPGGAGVDRPAVVFLDVGQGDAALVLGSEVTILIDGGPDPAVLDRKLDRYGVGSIDLVVASHVHADHLEGLAGVFGHRPVGRLWQAFGRHSTPASDRLLEAAALAGVRRFEPEPTDGFRVGDVELEVVGPQRRYAAANDESIVLSIRVKDTVFLFPGDVEVFAQRELGRLDPDVLKVPHQGAATSDHDWLEVNAGSLAVISVGPNDYGHPSEKVVATLTGAGADVRRTDQEGDVVVQP